MILDYHRSSGKILVYDNDMKLRKEKCWFFSLLVARKSYLNYYYMNSLETLEKLTEYKFDLKTRY